MVYKLIGSVVVYRKYNNYIVTLLLAFLLFGAQVGSADDLSVTVISYSNDTPANVSTNNTGSIFVNTSISNKTVGNLTSLLNWNRSLVGWWRMNETAGNETQDFSGYRNNGTWNGNDTSTVTSGRFGNALQFDGVDDYVNASNDPSLNITSAITIEAWVKPIAYSVGGIVAKRLDWHAENVNYNLFFDSTSKLGFYNGTLVVNTNDTIPLNVWSHVVVTVNDTTTTFFINGVFDSNHILGIGVPNHHPLLIGSHGNDGNYFNGTIDEVRIYNRALSTDEINASYDAGTYRLQQNFTGLSNGNYSYQAFVQDRFGAVNQTENRTVMVNSMLSGPAIIPMGTTYDPLSGGFANEVAPNFTLNVQVINTSNGVNLTNVTVNISSVNTTINDVLMVQNGSNGNNYYFNLTARVDKVVRGTFNATVTAYDNPGNSNTTNLSIEAHMHPGLNVIGWNSSRARPAYPTNVSLFYNNTPIIIIVNTTDDTQYSNITIDFSGVDSNSTLVFNNSGVLIPGTRNYSYTLTHTLGNIPTENVTIAWINATCTHGNNMTIPRMAALVVVSNMNPKDNTLYDLSGATTDWKAIPDYSAAYLTFEKVPAGNKVATLRFNEPINLTDYTTAMNLRTLGDKMIMAQRSINLTAASDALREFNKSANLTIYDLTAFTTSPAIFQDGTLIALPEMTSGGAASNISWDQSSFTLTLNVSHWTNYSWGTYGVNLTNVTTLTGSAIAGMNVIYIFTLQNNGTLSDSYNLTISNPIGASTAALNVTGNITLAANEIRTLLLNVTNTTYGTFYVNVTARSNNDTTKVGYINTTTTVMNATGSVNGTITDFWFNSLQISGVKVILTNITGGTYTNSSTDSTGNYYISGVVTSISNPYNYTISASKANYTTNASATVTVSNTSTNTTNLTLRALNGTLRGSYIKTGTGIEVSGATVSLTNTTLGTITRTTDASGTYSASLYPATYFVNVSKTGYISNSTIETVASNDTRTVPAISLSPNTVRVTANRTVGYANSGQNVSFNLTVINTGDDATFNVTPDMDAGTIVTLNAFTLLLNNTTPAGYVNVEVNNSNFGGWPVTITISNSSKSASVTLNAIMRNASANYTNISSNVNSSATVVNATLVNASIGANVNISGDSTLIMDVNVTGSSTLITDNAVIKGSYANSSIDNSTVGNATVDSSNLIGSTVSNNASITNSTLTGATVSNSTLTNVYVTSTSIITNVANLSGITLGGVTIIGDPGYDYQGEILAGPGWVTYQNINFTTIYTDILVSLLVIEQSPDQNILPNTSTTLNDSVLGTSMNFSMTINLSTPAIVNVSETGINPDGSAPSSGTLIGKYLFVQSNTTNVTNNTLRLYFDTDPSTYSGGVAIYYFNTSAATPAWEALNTTGSGTEGGRYYIEAIPNHFSTFALLGTTTSGGGDSPRSGGNGGSGGGGVVTSEPYDNIARSETYDKDLVSNRAVLYTFKLPEHGIYEISVTGKESENSVALRVEALKGPTKIAGISAPPGTVYKNVNVWAGSKRIKEGLIRFKVENTWIANNNIASGDLLMVRWNGNEWAKLETSELKKDDTHTFYEAKTEGFSSFAITALKGAGVPAATPATGVTEIAGTPIKPAGTETAAPMPTKKTPGFTVTFAVASLFAIYVLRIKRR
jgi:PGF-pre-PGF domain-containing protein